MVTIATRSLTITQGNIYNSHMYLTEVMDIFPLDVLGGHDESQAAPRTVRVLWGEEAVETDIVREKHIFRRRGWVRRFFDANRIVEGDRVLLEQLDPYLYRVSRAEVQGEPGAAADRARDGT
jgi:DNA polymerase III subunit epsilon